MPPMIRSEELVRNLHRFLKCLDEPNLDVKEAHEWLTRQLFVLVPEQEQGSSPAQLLSYVASLGRRQVCQHQFKTNDIVWICKQCQKDETCVICNACYQKSNHEGHDVYFYHSIVGGCCDCGDPDAWNAAGFCADHGHKTDDPVSFLPPKIGRVAALIFEEVAESLNKFASHMTTLYDLEAPRRARPEDLCRVLLIYDEFHTLEEFGALLRSVQDAPLRPQTLQSQGEIELMRGDFETCRGLAVGLSSSGFNVAVGYVSDLRRGRRMLAAVQWLSDLAQTNDGMCRLICLSLDEDLLTRLLKADLHLPKQLATLLHDLLLLLMADQSFKVVIAVAYTKAYRVVSQLYSRGLGMSSSAVYSLSVQFLNREVFVNEICLSHGFLAVCIDALKWQLSHAEQQSADQPLVPSSNTLSPSITKALSHKIILKRRYNPVVGDLKVLFSIPHISRLFLSSNMGDWLSVLETVMYVHPQERAMLLHVEHEDHSWMAAFNLNLCVSSMFDYLFNWFGSADAAHSLTMEFPGFGSPLEKTEEREDGWPEGASPCVELSGPPTGPIQLTSVWRVLHSVLVRCQAWEGRFRDSVGVGTPLPMVGPTLRDMVEEYTLSGRGQLPHLLSFHCPLHRALAYALSEACKHPHLLSSVHSLQQYCRHLAPQARSMGGQDRQTHALTTTLDIPLFSVVLGTQIRLGMWLRNGSVMGDQHLNYAEHPFCRIYKELDTLLVQLLVTTYPTDQFIGQLLYRFGVAGSLAHHRNPEYPALLDEALKFVVNIVTELPTQPNADVAARLRPLVRRELVHRLVTGSASYSQLQDACAIYTESAKVSCVIDQVVEDITTKNDSSVTGPPMYSLKRECWAEYDPCFPRVKDAAHQAAVEERPRVTATAPITSKPLPPHEAFGRLRREVLLSPVLLAVLRDLLLVVAAERTSKASYGGVAEWTLQCSDSVYNRVLQLLTLVMYEVQELSGQLGAQSELVAQFEQFVREEVASVGGGDSVSSAMDALMGLAPKVGVTHPCLLQVMLDIHGANSQDDKHWIAWLIDQVANLSPACAALAAASSDSTQSSEEDVKRAAMEAKRLAAMGAMQASAAQFMMMMEGVSDSDEEEDSAAMTGASEGPALQAPSATPAKGEEELPVCIICQTDPFGGTGKLSQTAPAASERVMGYLALAQASALLQGPQGPQGAQGGGGGGGGGGGVKGPMYVVDAASQARIDSTVAPRHTLARPPGAGTHELGACHLHTSFCGHVMHQDCFEVYRVAQVARAAEQTFTALDPTKSQFSCPLCKKMGNLFVPHVEVSERNVRYGRRAREGREGREGKEESMMETGGRDPLTPQIPQIRMTDLGARVSAEEQPGGEWHWASWIDSPSLLRGTTLSGGEKGGGDAWGGGAKGAKGAEGAEGAKGGDEAPKQLQEAQSSQEQEAPPSPSAPAPKRPRSDSPVEAGAGAGVGAPRSVALVGVVGTARALWQAVGQLREVMARSGEAADPAALESLFGAASGVAQALDALVTSPATGVLPAVQRVVQAAAAVPGALEEAVSLELAAVYTAAALGQAVKLAVNLALAVGESTEGEAVSRIRAGAYQIRTALDGLIAASTSITAAFAGRAPETSLAAEQLSAALAGVESGVREGTARVELGAGVGAGPVQETVEAGSRLLLSVLQRMAWCKYLGDLAGAVYRDDCLRVLSRLDKLVGAPALRSYDIVVPLLEVAAGAVVYSAACDSAEHNLPGYHLLTEGQVGAAIAQASSSSSSSRDLGDSPPWAYIKKYSTGTDDLRFLEKSVDALGCALHCFEALQGLDEALGRAFEGTAFLGREPTEAEQVCRTFAPLHGLRHWMPRIGAGAGGASSYSALVSLPLLDMPALQCLVLCAALSKAAPGPSEGGGLASSSSSSSSSSSDYNPVWNVEHAHKWLCLARLLQLLLVEVEGSRDEPGAPADSPFAAWPSAQGFLSQLLTLCELGARSLSAARAGAVLLQWVAYMRTAAHLLYRTHCFGAAGVLPPPQEWAAGGVLVCEEGVTDAQLRRHLSLLGMPELLDVGGGRGSNKFLAVSAAWIGDWLACRAALGRVAAPDAAAAPDAPSGEKAVDIGVATWPELTPTPSDSPDLPPAPHSASGLSQPLLLCPPPHLLCPATAQRPGLIALPREYTQLHGQVMDCIAQHQASTEPLRAGAGAGARAGAGAGAGAGGDTGETLGVPAQANAPEAPPEKAKKTFDFPALCLRCSAVLDASGHGQCAAHALRCGGESCLFFLLQDCQILLSHGPRSAYFSSPYTDVHGESHRVSRGRPLHLDERRYEALVRLQNTHSLPREVLLSRTTVSRIIINNFY